MNITWRDNSIIISIRWIVNNTILSEQFHNSMENRWKRQKPTFRTHYFPGLVQALPLKVWRQHSTKHYTENYRSHHWGELKWGLASTCDTHRVTIKRREHHLIRKPCKLVYDSVIISNVALLMCQLLVVRLRLPWKGIALNTSVHNSLFLDAIHFLIWIYLITIIWVFCLTYLNYKRY